MARPKLIHAQYADPGTLDGWVCSRCGSWSHNLAWYPGGILDDAALRAKGWADCSPPPGFRPARAHVERSAQEAAGLLRRTRVERSP